MKAIILREIGTCEALRLEDVADPVAGRGEVVVKLKAAALNHRDVWIRKGQYAGIRLPTILGSDGCGTVLHVGDGISTALIGQSVVLNPGLDWGDNPRIPGPKFRVLGMPDDGTYAEMIRIPASSVAARPNHLSALEAASLPLAGLTAYRALVTRAGLKSGETVLITGIGGGVSAIALQLAKAIGSRVVVTSRSEEKLALAKTLGADEVLHVGTDDWSKQAIRLCGEDGPDVILDSVGGETFSRALGIVRRGGRIVTYGATTGPAERLEITRLFWKQVDILGSTMGNDEEFGAMLRLVDKHKIRPPVSKVYPLAEAANAQRFMEQSEQFGKIVLEIAT